MRTTLAIDDDLLAKAQEYTGLQEKSALVREALKALVERDRSSPGAARWHRTEASSGPTPALADGPSLSTTLVCSHPSFRRKTW